MRTIKTFASAHDLSVSYSVHTATIFIYILSIMTEGNLAQTIVRNSGIREQCTVLIKF